MRTLSFFLPQGLAFTQGAVTHPGVSTPRGSKWPTTDEGGKGTKAWFSKQRCSQALWLIGSLTHKSQRWKPPKCPSAMEYLISKMGFIHTTGYGLAIKRNEAAMNLKVL